MKKVVIIGAGPGDPELITLKGKRNLEKADVVIYAGSLLNPQILQYAKPDAELYDSAKMSLKDVLKVMVDGVNQGKFVARVHDGDPSFFGAITEQMDFLDTQGIEYEVIPGVSCLQGGAAALRRELTLPNVSQSVIITRPEGRTPVPEPERIRELAKHGTTMVIFLGIQHVEKVIKELELSGRSKDTPVSVVYRATWKEQKIVRGTIEDIVQKVKDAGITRTALIFVGEVLNPKAYDFSKLYDPKFTHGYRKGEDDVS
ncbi:MAG: precorrin-4 C(11)-methyltransferase [Candidatus Bathyarchaeota archaeon]|nr:precorrin-4 C(11)-methyltransferase [Candidatus Bathyarchaeota archaeon]